MTLALRKVRDLRYGENPHQQAAFYAVRGEDDGAMVAMEQVHGKAASFNNVLDINAAWRMAADYAQPTVAIVKHQNPCGIASELDITAAYRRAFMCDSVSAFGGIVGANRIVTKQLAEVKSIMGTDRVTALWRAATADVDQIARRGDPNAVYAKNNAFWRALSTTAIHVAVADEAPSKWDLAKEAIKDSVVHLPDTLSDIASKGVDAVAATAHAAGKVVNEAGKGLFSGAGTPILIGAGVLGAVLLFRRGRRHEEA
jgi:hypothetical protein